MWDTFRLPYIYRTYGTKESRKEGRSSKAIALDKMPTCGIGCYRSSTKRCGMTDSEACQWDEPEQTAEHKSPRPVRRRPEMRKAWLQDTELIDGDTRKKILSGVD